MKRSRRVCFPWPLALALLLAFLTSSFAAVGEDKPVSVMGKWQLSWEARLGTERGTMQLDQADSKLTGSFQGHLSSKISGSIKDKSIRLNLDFAGAHPFTLVFTGTVDGDKMAGKFEIQGVKDGYDWHGENASPSNYSWTAVRQAEGAAVR
jgi:hypothetical protein